jgi:hypothetical protein
MDIRQRQSQHSFASELLSHCSSSSSSNNYIDLGDMLLHSCPSCHNVRQHVTMYVSQTPVVAVAAERELYVVDATRLTTSLLQLA